MERPRDSKRPRSGRSRTSRSCLGRWSAENERKKRRKKARRALRWRTGRKCPVDTWYKRMRQPIRASCADGSGRSAAPMDTGFGSCSRPRPSHTTSLLQPRIHLACLGSTRCVLSAVSACRASPKLDVEPQVAIPSRCWDLHTSLSRKDTSCSCIDSHPALHSCFAGFHLPFHHPPSSPPQWCPLVRLIGPLPRPQRASTRPRNTTLPSPSPTSASSAGFHTASPR